MKWVTMWATAQSIVKPLEAKYAKNLTLRYPLFVPFKGNKIRITLDNYCIDEEVNIDSVSVCKGDSLSDKINLDEIHYLSFHGKRNVTIPPHEAILSDPLDIDIDSPYLIVTIYLKEYCNLTGGVAMQGPLYKGFYAYGDQREKESLDINTSMETNWMYFLSNVDLYTDDNNECVICYGDSITAQDWPDYMQLKLKEMGIDNVAIIRKAVCGTRILRQYDCIKYQSYGLKGSNRFSHEIDSVCSANKIIIQQGINDIIHPVGKEINIFRPMSDLPTVTEMITGIESYLTHAKETNLQAYVGTLLPIYNWRTYAPFRETMKNDFNNELKKMSHCLDFEKVVGEYSIDHYQFKEGFDSGDHLHPSKSAYQKMGEYAALTLFKKD